MRRATSAVLAFAVAAATLGTAGCATIDPLEDTRIEAEVKARLVGEKAANLTRVGVESRAAVVRLTGTVASEDQRTRAETLTRDVPGVRRVENDLGVRAP